MVKSLAIWAALSASAAGISGGAIIATSTVPIEPVPEIASPYNGCGQCSLPARQIAWSLDNQGDQWSSDHYRANRRGIWIWVANEAYGLQVNTVKDVVPHDFGWIPSPLDRELIYSSYARWKDKHSLHVDDIHP